MNRIHYYVTAPALLKTMQDRGEDSYHEKLSVCGDLDFDAGDSSSRHIEMANCVKCLKLMVNGINTIIVALAFKEKIK